MTTGANRTSKKIKCVSSFNELGTPPADFRPGQNEKKIISATQKIIQMETIKATIERTDFPTRKLEKPSLEVSPSITAASNKITINQEAGCCEISKYNDAPMNGDDISVAVKKLSVAYPNQSRDFFLLMTERMLANGFTRRRCEDAINFIIDSNPYGRISIADVIKFDKKRKLYTYGQMCAKLKCNGGTEDTADSFSIVEIDGKKYWYLPNENI